MSSNELSKTIDNILLSIEFKGSWKGNRHNSVFTLAIDSTISNLIHMSDLPFWNNSVPPPVNHVKNASWVGISPHYIRRSKPHIHDQKAARFYVVAYIIFFNK